MLQFPSTKPVTVPNPIPPSRGTSSAANSSTTITPSANPVPVTFAENAQSLKPLPTSPPPIPSKLVNDSKEKKLTDDIEEAVGAKGELHEGIDLGQTPFYVYVIRRPVQPQLATTIFAACMNRSNSIAGFSSCKLGQTGDAVCWAVAFNRMCVLSLNSDAASVGAILRVASRNPNMHIAMATSDMMGYGKFEAHFIDCNVISRMLVPTADPHEGATEAMACVVLDPPIREEMSCVKAALFNQINAFTEMVMSKGFYAMLAATARHGPSSLCLLDRRAIMEERIMSTMAPPFFDSYIRMALQGLSDLKLDGIEIKFSESPSHAPPTLDEESWYAH